MRLLNMFSEMILTFSLLLMMMDCQVLFCTDIPAGCENTCLKIDKLATRWQSSVSLFTDPADSTTL